MAAKNILTLTKQLEQLAAQELETCLRSAKQAAGLATELQDIDQIPAGVRGELMHLAREITQRLTTIEAIQCRAPI